MTKTPTEVIEMAHRRLRVLSVDEPPSADQVKFGGDVLTGLSEELFEVEGMAFAAILTEYPDAAFLPLSYLLAVEIAPHYDRPAEPRSRAMSRLRRYAFPDDRDDRRDTDGDGVVSDAESENAKGNVYF